MRLTMLALLLAALVVPAIGAHKEFGFVGTLTKVDLAKNTVTVVYKENGKDATLGLKLTPKTEILNKDKQKVARTTLKVGLSVVVRAWGDGDKPVMDALSIRIVPPLAK